MTMDAQTHALMQAAERSYETQQRPTLRDQFAMAALTGFVQNFSPENPPEHYADASYIIADAMIAAREVNNK